LEIEESSRGEIMNGSKARAALPAYCLLAIVGLVASWYICRQFIRTPAPSPSNEVTTNTPALPTVPPRRPSEPLDARLGDGTSPDNRPMLARSRADYVEYLSAAGRIFEGDVEARYFNALQELMQRDGRLFFATNGVRVTVIRYVEPLFEVKIVEGDLSGRTGWVPMTWLNLPSDAIPESIGESNAKPDAIAPTTASTTAPSLSEQARANDDKEVTDTIAKEKAAAVASAAKRESEGRSRRAATLLDSARNLEKAKKIPAALDFYRQIIRDYPGTSQADEASKRISALQTSP
jgi:hypothetical protein